jgi:adenylyltransferase/sulfurtransferase
MPRQITVDELARMLAEGAPVILLDVRQPWEHETARLPDSVLIPLPELDERAAEVAPPAGSLVVAYCHHGVRSLTAAALLEATGMSDVASLTGGIDAWSRHVDPGILRY